MSSISIAGGVASGTGRPRTVLEGIGPRALGFFGCVVLLGLVALMSLALGSAEIDIASVFGALTAFDGSNEHLIVTELRLPRTLVGIAVGASLALAGVLMQGVARNPLAEPGIFGVNAGAALGVVIAIVAFGVGEAERADRLRDWIREVAADAVTAD